MHAIGAIDREAPMLYQAAEPLPERRADRELAIDLTGSMMTYRWGIAEKAAMAHHAHLAVQEGERVEMTLTNRTEMSHPMHLHGHHFQVVAVDGARVKGAVRDTELVPVGGCGDPGVRRRQSRQVDVPLSQPVPHAVRDDDAGAVPVTTRGG